MQGKSTVGDLDEQDRRIVQQRAGAYLGVGYAQVGDFVRFADGVERRASHVWNFEDDLRKWSVQTSDGGSFYLGEDGYCSFSGGLHQGIPMGTLRRTGNLRRGSCWIFHHDHHTAHNGVELELPIFTEWTSSVEAPR